MIFEGCSGTKPKDNEIIGKWYNNDGALLKFNNDGTFIGKSLPAEIFIINTSEYERKRFDCKGKWSINSNSKSWDQLPWSIYLDFAETIGILYEGGASLLISGSSFFENKRPWRYIFRWVREEGDERYKFKKKL